MKNQSNLLIVGKYYPEFNGLRAMAILFVIVAHCTIESAPVETFSQGIYWKIMSTGWVGVDLFFVLSGFLITGILLDTASNQNCLKIFYIRRFLRIFPLYYLVLSTYYLSMFVIGNVDSFGFQTMMYFLYIGNWDELMGFDRPYELDHVWSLAIEEQFYLIWPTLLFFFHNRNLSRQLCILAILSTFILRIIFTLNNYGLYAYDITITRGDGLLAGSLLAIMLKEKTIQEFAIKNILLLLCFGSIIIVAIAYTNGSFFGRHDLVVMFGLSALPLVFIPLIMLTMLLHVDHPIRTFLSSPILVFIGKISYGMYLYHWFIIVLIKYSNIFAVEYYGYWITQALFLVSALPLTIIIAWISYKYVEKPILSYKDKWAPYKFEITK